MLSQARLTILQKERKREAIHTTWTEHTTRIKLRETGFCQEKDKGAMMAMAIPAEVKNLMEDKVIFLVRLKLRTGNMTHKIFLSS